MPAPVLPLRARLLLAVKAVTGLFSERSASEAYGMLAGLWPSASGPMSERGTREILEGYGKMPWLRAVTQKIGETVAATQWQLLAPTGRTAPEKLRGAVALIRSKHLPAAERTRRVKDLLAQEDLRVIEEHPFLDVLEHPNEMIVGQSLLHLTQVHVDLVGEAFWIKDRNGAGAPAGFWPIPPHWVRQTPTVTRRSYSVQWSAWQGDIPDTDVVWFKHADPANPYGRGSGLARTLADELETDEYAARHTRMTFLNRARPDLIIYPKEGKFNSGNTSIENADRLAEKWRAGHQGFLRAALPYFATRELGVHEMRQDFAELQLVDLRKHERDVIIQTYGMPPEELGITESSNRATANVSEFIFKKNLIVPRLEFLRSTLQERVLPEYDERLILSYVSPVSEDREFLLEVAKAQPGTLLVDEWRARQGLPELPDGAGQVFLIPTTVTIRQDLTEQPVPLALAAPPLGLPPTQRALLRRAATAADWGQALAACRDAGDTATAAIIRREMADDPDALPELSRRVARREPAFRRLVAAQLTALRESAPLATWEQAVGRGLGPDGEGADGLLPWHEWGAELRVQVRPPLEEAFVVGATVGAAAAGVKLVRSAAPVAKADPPQFEFNRANQLAVAWAERQAAELVAGLTDVTKAGVRAAVAEALRLGWSAERTARAIRASVGLTDRQAASVVKFAERLADKDPPVSDARLWARVDRYADAQVRARALLIARTELASASSAGQQELWDNAAADGVLDISALQKVWLTTDDDALCDECEPLGEEEVDVDGTFSNGDDGPPAHPGCRCASGLVRTTATEALRAGVAAARATAASKDFADVISAAVSDGIAGLAAALDRLPAPAAPVVHVLPATVNVAAPVVNVAIPPRGKVVRTPIRDAHGIISHIIEEPAP